MYVNSEPFIIAVRVECEEWEENDDDSSSSSGNAFNLQMMKKMLDRAHHIVYARRTFFALKSAAMDSVNQIVG